MYCGVHCYAPALGKSCASFVPSSCLVVLWRQIEWLCATPLQVHVCGAAQVVSSSWQVVDSKYFASCFVLSLKLESPRRILFYYRYCRHSAFILMIFGKMRNYG
jgi:hypothetical protein